MLFYTIGGGFEGQRGLEFLNLENTRTFGIGENTEWLPDEKGVILVGVEEFQKRLWRVGDTYNTASKYGFRLPDGMARFVAG